MRFRLDSSLDDATSWTAAPARAQRELIGTIAGAALLEGGRTVRRWDDALSALDWLDLDRRRRPGQWVGFLAYELGRLLEPAAAFRRQAAGDDRLPLFHWGWTGDDHHRLGRRLRTGFDRNAPSAPEAERLPAAPPAPDWTSQFSRGAYERAVARCIDYIAAGDVFQVNLSQRLSMPFGGSAEALYSALCRQSPAPYAALLEWDQLALISNSPELFLRVEPDGRIVTRPIKGTRPAGPGNAHLAEELRASAKDAAELNMIVDLERNDLGRVCEVGSVRVTQSRDIEAYPSVFHGVATVEGRLRAGVGLVELLRATFPGGSVTGAPKIRAMQIIEEIEPCPRGAYCGAIGRLDSDGSLTLNVAIRTMMLQKRRRLLHIPVGGGNVADSDPAAEYEETLVKARAMLMAANQVARTAPVAATLPGRGPSWRDEPTGPRPRMIAATGRFPRTGRLRSVMPDAWLNGAFTDEDQASVSISDAGLLHAAGVFTTMRAAAGRVVRVGGHLRRLRRSCEALYVPLPYDDAALGRAAADLIARNALGDARLRLTVTRGRTVRDPLHGESFRSTVILTAEELAPYPAEFYERGMTAVLNSDQKLNPYDVQAGHKTLDYFSRFAALREAARRGAGESLWFNVHNFLQSGSISNVFLVEEIDGAPALVTPPTNEDLREETVRRSCPYPRSNVLPGVTRSAVIEWARGQGIAVHRVPIDVNRLLAAREVFLTNSIMGVMPVTRLEQKVVGEATPGDVMHRAAAAVM